MAIVGVLSAAGAPAAQAGTDPIGAHSMLQVNSPYWLMQAMFAQAANLHAGTIRLDVAPALIFPYGPDHPDFSGLDEIMGLAQQYNLRVSADLFTVPAWLADCSSPAPDRSSMARCGTDDLSGYASVVSAIVNHADSVIHDWEIWNEPDSGEFFTGTPARYAGMLRAAHDAIKQADPQANVLLGGISGPAGMNWLAQVLATPGVDAPHAFDTASVHERSSLDALAPDIVSWRWFLAAHGFTGPLWVTEHGYPSDPAFEYDPRYGAGPASQAAYLRASVPTLIEAGATRVFVTERDNLSGQFASEGIVARPAYATVRAIADCYRLLGRDCPGSPPTATPAPLAIPAVRIGSAGSAAVTVSDAGPGPLQLGPAALAPGAGPAITLQADGCPAILEPDHTCTVQLRFAPATGGPQGATLQLPSDSGGLAVAVTAVAPSVASLTSVQLRKPSFAAVRATDGVGSTQQLVLDLTNPLAAPVRLARATVGGVGARQFGVSAGACTSAPVAPGATCRVSVRFEPTHAGTARATLTLRGDGQPVKVALRATALRPPAVQLPGPSGSTGCVTPALGNQLVVMTDAPATVAWRAVRTRRPPARGCAAARASGRGSASGRSTTMGWVATRRIRVKGHRSYVARFRLPVSPGRRGLTPGAYQLTVAATGRHATSLRRTVAFTVAG